MASYSVAKPVQMLLEDSPSDVRLMREALKETSLPIVITVAHDGVEAMDMLHKTESGEGLRPDLVLLDLNLPCKTAMKCCRK